MGDIDYLVPPEHFDQAKGLLLANGYEIEDDPRNPRHMHVHKDSISFEQHRFFSSEGIDVERFISEGMNHIEMTEIYGTSFPMLPKLANGLVLLGHMVQHLKSGLGLRQVVDWMMFVNSELTDTFWTEMFEPAAKESGLDKVAVITTQMCVKHLGLPAEIHWCEEGEEKLCLELMESLLSSGNFDRKRGKGSSVERVVASIRGKGLFKNLQVAGEYNWKAYHKHKWLKPLAWAYQIGRYAKKGFQAKRSGKQLKEDWERGKNRDILLNKMGIKNK